MSQIRVYGLKENLNPIKAELSDVIHSCVVDALHFPSIISVLQYPLMCRQM